MVLILASVGTCLYCFYTCFYASNRKKQDPYCKLHGQQFLEVQEQIYASTRRMEQIPFEAVTIRSFDGLTLYGRYYHMKDGAPVKIIFTATGAWLCGTAQVALRSHASWV